MWKQIPVYNVETDTGIMWNCWYRAYGVQELCESRGGRPGLPSLIVLMVSVDVKQQLKRKIVLALYEALVWVRISKRTLQLDLA